MPTANVDADSLRQSLAEAVTGIYCGWASIGDSPQVGWLHWGTGHSGLRAVCLAHHGAGPAGPPCPRPVPLYCLHPHTLAVTPRATQVYKMCMSIGWNPFYGNTHKTAEPWILHTFDEVRHARVHTRGHAVAASTLPTAALPRWPSSSTWWLVRWHKNMAPVRL